MGKMKSKEVLRQVRRSGDSIEHEVRLRVGDIIEMGGVEHFVWFVNPSRAAVIPLRNVQYTFKTLEKDVAFLADPASVNISANSEVPIIKRLGREGLIQFLAQRTEERKVMAKNKEEKNGKNEDEGPKLGHLGGFLGHPVTGVIRAMGVAGWSFKEVRYTFDKAKIQVADNTIRIQLHKGKSGAQEPAEVSKKELAELRSKIPAEVTESKADKKKDGKAKSKAKAGKAAKAKDNGGDDEEDDEGDEPAPKSKKAKIKPAKKDKEEDEDGDDDEGDEPRVKAGKEEEEDDEPVEV